MRNTPSHLIVYKALKSDFKGFFILDKEMPADETKNGSAGRITGQEGVLYSEFYI